MTDIKYPEEIRQDDIQKRLEQLHAKLKSLNLPIAAHRPTKDNQATGTTANKTAVNHD